MTEMAPEAIFESEEGAPSVAPPRIEASCWRLGPDGFLLTSVTERHVAQFAEHDKGAIYFYADLQESDMVKNDDGTAKKVFASLASVGLTEGQIIKAINQMQQDGILFRESAV